MKAVVKLLNGSMVAHVGTVVDPPHDGDIRVVVESEGMTFEAWNLERYEDFFIATSWKRLD